VSNLNIQQLIKKALTGDQKAYESLLKRYQNGVYNMIYQMIKNREETEDLVQEAFIKAFKSLESYNEEYAFSTWLYKIAFNHCIDAIRKKKLKTLPLDRPIQLKEGEVRHEIRDDAACPEGDYIFAERKKLIQESINSLPERYRIAIVLRHQKEYSYEEISKMLDIPLGTVKARIFRAREMLKKKLQEK
jgi:RNA polymerase sigma-70 factor (ECF subfamily)